MHCRSEGLYICLLHPGRFRYLSGWYSIHTWLISPIASLSLSLSPNNRKPSLLFSPSLPSPFFLPLSSTPGCHYPRRCFAAVLLWQVKTKALQLRRRNSRIDYLKQSAHVISTSRPRQTNSGPVYFLLPSLSSTLLSFSPLFPNWYGIHGWSATVISIHLFFSQHVTFAWHWFPNSGALAEDGIRLHCTQAPGGNNGC